MALKTVSEMPAKAPSEKSKSSSRKKTKKLEKMTSGAEMPVLEVEAELVDSPTVIATPFSSRTRASQPITRRAGGDVMAGAVNQAVLRSNLPCNDGPGTAAAAGAPLGTGEVTDAPPFGAAQFL